LRNPLSPRVSRTASRGSTFIAYELQFHDGSGLIQFNGTPGELYARRHLVPRSCRIHEHVHACMCVRARARASFGTRHQEAPPFGTLNDNGNNNNLIQHSRVPSCLPIPSPCGECSMQISKSRVPPRPSLSLSLLQVLIFLIIYLVCSFPSPSRSQVS